MSEPDRQSFSAGALRMIDGAISGLVRATLSTPANLVSEVDRFRLIREKTLSLLGGLSESQAAWTSRQGTWSIAQIADHLLRSEELYRTQFNRLIAVALQGKSTSIQIDLREIDTSLAWIPVNVLRVFETPVRLFSRMVPDAIRETLIRYPIVPASNPNAAEPRTDLSVDTLRVDLAEAMAITVKLLSGPLPANVDRPTIDHPLMGSNNLPALFRILMAHEERHQGQIAALRGSSDFPGPTQAK
jgi:uncharacterized damage-inducible protein DinB